MKLTSQMQVAFDRGAGSRCISHARENPYCRDTQPALHAQWEAGWEKTDVEANHVESSQ